MNYLLSKKRNTVISLILVLTLVLGLSPISAFAATEKSESSKLVDIFYEEIVNEYYDDVYSAVYELVAESGVIQNAIAEIDGLIALVEDAQARIPSDVPDEIPEELPEDWPEEIPDNWLEQIPQDVLDQIPPEVLEELLNKYGHGSAQPAVVTASAEPANEYTEYVAYVNQLREETALALTTLNEMKAILEGDDLTTLEGLDETLDYLTGTVRERLERIELLWVLIAAESDELAETMESAVEAIEQIELIEKELKTNIIPAVDAALEAIAAVAYNPACEVLGIFLDKQVSSADEVADALKKIAGMSEDEIMARIDELVKNATHAKYAIDDESLYVAFGNITSRNSYVKLLAEELKVDYKDKSVAGMTLEILADQISAYKTDISKADLITLNFGEVEAFVEVVTNVAASNANYNLDWVRYLGEDYADIEKDIDEALEAVYAELAASGIDAKLAEACVAAVEVYAYECLVHAFNLDKVVTEIKKMNPEALIVVVGTYNPLQDVTYDHNGTVIELGAYVEYLFNAFGVYDLAYAIISDDVTYVDAPDVDTLLNETALSTEMLAKLSAINLMPSDAGHKYIQEQIWNALTITREEKEDDGPAPTGDYNLLIPVAVLFALSAAAAVVMGIGKKRSF